MAGGHWKIRLGGGRRDSGSPTLGGRLVASLFFGVFLAAGCLFVGLIGREAWRGAETYGWQAQRCEIVASRVVRAGGEKPYRAEVAYHTLAAPELVSGSRIQRREPKFSSHGDARARLAPYASGASVACWVSPEREAVLERGPLWMGLWLLLPLVFVAIGGVGLVASWTPARRDDRGNPVQPALGERAARTGPGRGLTTLGLVFALIGGATSWFFAVVPLAGMVDARSWTRTTCTVEHSSVVAHEGDEGTTYSVDILYRWDRGRGVERSSRYAFFGASTSSRAAKAEVVRAHPVGAEVPCWVDPERRDEAVLERGLTPLAFFALIPLGFFAAGCAMIVAGRRRAARRDRVRSRAASGGAPFGPDDPVLDVLPDFELEPGPLTLRARSSRWGRVAGITGAALFWNGIVAVFANEAARGWERGHPDWFLTLFLVPFVLVGIGLVVAIFHALLALANPRPRLVVSTRAPRLGERIEIQWRFRGRVGRLARVRLALEGTEQATYQVGTDTRTSSESFFEAVVADVPAPACAVGGHAVVTVPADSMHSFESKHNKIVWELTLRGEIARWPDVSERYALVVLPGRGDDGKPEEG